MIVFAALFAAATGAFDTLAQDAKVLGPPGEIRVDTTFGAVGDWFAVETLAGDVMPFQDFQGRVLFVNFWATWCAPCVKEMPTIVDLAESMSGTDVAFLLISIDDDKRLVRRFARKHKLGSLVYLRAWKSGDSTFTAGIVPATFIVDKDGQIAYQHHGAANWNTESIRHYLTRQADG